LLETQIKDVEKISEKPRGPYTAPFMTYAS